MLFVCFYTLKPGLTRQQVDEVYRRRASWKFPHGVEVVGEYWLHNPPHWVLILEAGDVGALTIINYFWQDVFDIQTFPAVTADQGLALLGLRRRRGRRPKALRLPEPTPTSLPSTASPGSTPATNSVPSGTAGEVTGA